MCSTVEQPEFHHAAHSQFCLTHAGAGQLRDPFYAISPADLRQAILDELHGELGSTAMEISLLVWPQPGPDREPNRSHMKNKVHGT